MLSVFLKDYLSIIIFLVLALGLSCAFIVVNFILSPKKPDPEKLSTYLTDYNCILIKFFEYLIFWSFDSNEYFRL